jgi:TatD DNase family protein
MFIDTHAHLYVEQFEEDRKEMIARAQQLGVHKIYLPNIDASTIEAMNELAQSFPEFLFPMLGLHPCHVIEDYKEVLDAMRPQFEEETYYGVGESGIDLYWDQQYARQQEDALSIQCQWAKELDLPLILHTRSATEETIQLISEEQDGRLRGIFHCFGGDLKQASAIQDLNFMIGIGGVVTFKNSGLDKVVKDIPLDAIVLETDAPYLAPVPHRGKRNESSYIHLIAEKLATLYECSIEEIGQQTSGNALKVFGS